MNKTLVKFLITAFVYLAVLLPLWLRFKNLTWSSELILINLFPFFGLAAFSILWLHALSGVFEPWLRKHFDFDQFIHITSMLVLFFIVLHPMLLFIQIDFKLPSLFTNHKLAIWLAAIGWFLLITYDIGKALKKYDFFVRNWTNILTISTIGFLLTFFHSLMIGSDLQTGPLRSIWIFYGITAILATIYTYGIKRFLK